MKVSFPIIFKIFLILTILVGCATNEEIKETDLEALVNQGIALLKRASTIELYHISIRPL